MFYLYMQKLILICTHTGPHRSIQSYSTLISFRWPKNHLVQLKAEGRSFDDIPFSFQRVPIERPSGTVEFSAMLQQGSVLQITGPHDAGKGRLLKKFCDIDHSATGAILRPGGSRGAVAAEDVAAPLRVARAARAALR